MQKILLSDFNTKIKSDIFIEIIRCYFKRKAPSIHIGHVDIVHTDSLIKDVTHLYLISQT
jgi:hypothetical protein